MQSTALFKTGQLEVIRLVLPKGKAWPAHKVPGEIIVQCLAGAIDFTSEGSSRLLLAGQLLYLPGGVVHGLGAVEDAIVLLTIALHR